MRTKEELAEIARQNGAKSKGPKTEAGKEQSKRNAITHGERATVLKLLVPPHSSLLVYESRREFYALHDINIAKYQPQDGHENAVVREITDIQWSNGRARLAIHTMLNYEILKAADGPEPIIEENRSMESIIAAYESLNKSATLRNFHKEYAVNTRLIATLERRLDQVQRRWPVEVATLAAEKGSEPNKGTQHEEPEPIENKRPSLRRRVKLVNVDGPLTAERIRLYHLMFPDRDIRFNVIPPAAPIPDAA